MNRARRVRKGTKLPCPLWAAALPASPQVHPPGSSHICGIFTEASALGLDSSLAPFSALLPFLR